jgi:3-oxoadipate enol-lactonase
VVGKARELALDRSTDDLVEALGAIRDRQDRSDTLAGFARPVLVAVGEGDGFFPPDEAQQQARTAPRGRFRAFAGARHLPNLEQPDEFNAALTSFLADV